MKPGDIVHIKDTGPGRDIWHPYMEKFGIIVEMETDRDNNPTAIVFIRTELVEFYLDEIEEANEKM